MEISSQKHGQVVIVSIVGSIDKLTSDDISAYFDNLINSSNNQIVIDFRDVDYVSSAGLRALLAALKASRQQGGDLRLTEINSDIRSVLEMAGFVSILKVYSTLNEAVASFS